MTEPRGDAPAHLWAVRGSELEPLEAPHAAPDLHALFDGLSAGIYEGFRTFRGDLFLGLAEHLARALSSIERAGLDFDLDPEATTLAIGRAAAETPWEETRFRFDVLSRPASKLGTDARLILGAVELPPAPPALRSEGVEVATTDSLARSTPLLKTRAWAEERRELEAGEPYEHILLDEEGMLLEGTSSNLFLVRRGVVYTAGDRVLPGITRALVLRLCQENQVPARRTPITIDERDSFDEAFLTSASRGLVPVVRIDGEDVGEGRPGDLTHMLMAQYDLFVERHARAAVTRRHGR